jgi:heme-degrading monooxygenase HmoA
MAGIEMLRCRHRSTCLRSRGSSHDHFREKVVPELRQVPGFAGAQLARRQIGDKIEFLVLTRWRSMDAIRAFAGTDVEKAVVEPDAVAALLEFDGRVRHYDVVEEV